MEPRQLIRAGIAASVIAHLTVLALILWFADVHPFGSATGETIAVDIVSPKEVAEVSKQPELVPVPAAEMPPIPKPSDTDLSARSAAASAPPPETQAPQASQPPQPQAATRPQKQAVLPSPPPSRQPAAAQPQPTPAAASPGFLPPEPDLSVKYHVLLGLPQNMPGDGFDDPATAKADIASNLVAEFRRHLRTCLKLPESIAVSDKIRIVLRVMMAPDGKLAADPALIEASASAKGPLLMQSAISALQACQPYAMLPSERYREWKVLDLNFTPQDFTGG